MLSRRRFAACVLCATSGLLATGSVVRAQGFTRTVVKRIDYPGSAHATIQVLVEVEPGAFIARHTHSGVESATIIEGGGTLQIDGEAGRRLPGRTRPALRRTSRPGRPTAAGLGPGRPSVWRRQ